MLSIYCKNTGTSRKYPEGTSLLQMLGDFEFDQPWPIVSAKVNNVSQGLKFKVYKSKDIQFVSIKEESGMRVYSRSLCFLLYKAAVDVFPSCELYMEYPISGGYFFHLYKENNVPMEPADLPLIVARMKEIVEEDMPFHRYDVQTEKVLKLFREIGHEDKVKLLETSDEVYSDYYKLGDTPDYYYGRLVPSSGYLKVWGVEPYKNGYLLRLPDINNPAQLAPNPDQPKTFEVFNEHLKWNIIMRLNTVGDVNIALKNGKASELIQVAEALQEKKIIQIAEEIDRRYRSDNPVRIVLITGPSSSGKTTFCKKLSVQLKACGLRPISVSTDDYFVNREDTPRFPDGSFDFDNFDTVDHAMMQRDLLDVLEGKEVSVPEYNFVTGKREYNGKKLKLVDGSILLVEGIHALNPELTSKIDEASKFKIFINTLTSTALDYHNWIPTSDNRLLRRIVRDYNKGAFTAQQSINQWPMVQEAERKWIYPYQENADAMFNSAYLIEFAVLRNHAEPILSSVPKNCPEYSEAHRLLKFIHYFTPVSDREIPPTSMLREFLGGSSFTY